MDWLTFSSSVIDSLAWPMAALVAIILMRREIRKLLPSLRSLKYKSLELVFQRDVQKAAESSRKARRVIEPVVSESEVENRTEQLAHLIRHHPRMGYIEAYSQLEAAIRKAATQHDVKDASHRRVLDLFKELGRKELIGDDVAVLFAALKKVRNEIVHNPAAQLSSADAERLINSVLRLAEWFEKLR